MDVIIFTLKHQGKLRSIRYFWIRSRGQGKTVPQWKLIKSSRPRHRENWQQWTLLGYFNLCKKLSHCKNNYSFAYWLQLSFRLGKLLIFTMVLCGLLAERKINNWLNESEPYSNSLLIFQCLQIDDVHLNGIYLSPQNWVDSKFTQSGGNCSN